MTAPILILGVPRSGTTWIERVLAADPGVQEVHEPDNETEAPWALWAKRDLGRFPYLRGDVRARPYEALWRGAFSGGRQSPLAELARAVHRRSDRFKLAEATSDPARTTPGMVRALASFDCPLSMPGPRRQALVKSVHAALCADWIADHFGPRILLVRRDPFEVLASWRSLASSGDGMGSRLEFAGDPQRFLAPAALDYLSTRHRPPPAEPGEGRAWLVCALIAELDAFAASRPETVVIDFDAACSDPHGVLSRASQQLGLPWGPAADAAVASLNESGEGWETRRVTVAVPGAWRRRLSEHEVAEIEASLSRYLTERSAPPS